MPKLKDNSLNVIWSEQVRLNHFYIKETVNDFMSFEEIVEKTWSIFL